MELVPSVGFVCSWPCPRFLHSNCCVGVIQIVKVTESSPKKQRLSEVGCLEAHSTPVLYC